MGSRSLLQCHDHPSRLLVQRQSSQVQPPNIQFIQDPILILSSYLSPDLFPWGFPTKPRSVVQDSESHILFFCLSTL